MAEKYCVVENWDDYPNINFVVMRGKNNMNRSFCRCGCTVKYIADKCPKCGNNTQPEVVTKMTLGTSPQGVPKKVITETKKVNAKISNDKVVLKEYSGVHEEDFTNMFVANEAMDFVAQHSDNKYIEYVNEIFTYLGGELGTQQNNYLALLKEMPLLAKSYCKEGKDAIYRICGVITEIGGEQNEVGRFAAILRNVPCRVLIQDSIQSLIEMCKTLENMRDAEKELYKCIDIFSHPFSSSISYAELRKIPEHRIQSMTHLMKIGVLNNLGYALKLVSELSEEEFQAYLKFSRDNFGDEINSFVLHIKKHGCCTTKEYFVDKNIAKYSENQKTKTFINAIINDADSPLEAFLAA